MTIYEPEEFGDIWKPENMKHKRAIDKLKRMRMKKKEEEELKEEAGIPTSSDLEDWFSQEL